MAYALTTDQRNVAATIVDVGRSVGASDEEIIGALSAGIVESQLTNLPGGHLDSVGVFQQRPSQGWTGLRNVGAAAREFFTRLLGTGGGDIAERVANVQRPAAQYRYRYREQLDEAMSVFAQVVNSATTTIRSWQDLDDWLRSKGINVGAPSTGQTTGGSHVQGSYHYQGLGRDYGNESDERAVALALVPLAQGPNRVLDELYYSPLGIFYDNGVAINPNEHPSIRDTHYDHVHAGVRAGGASIDGTVSGALVSTETVPEGPIFGVLKSIDATLNTESSGLGDLLNPIDDLRVIVARSAVVLVGVTVGVFGLILVVSSVGKKSGLTDMAKMVPGPTSVAATAADVVDGAES